MKTCSSLRLLTSLTASVLMSSLAVNASEGRPDSMRKKIEAIVAPVMERHDIPGLAVGITKGGKHHFFNYGIDSKEGGPEVDENTLFEIGSLSKTFTATLAAYAQETGALSITDAASKHVPELAGTSFDEISLLQLGTYSAGGLPLQVPEDVTEDTLMDYYRHWQPEYEPGSHRRYSNPSIGLLGHIAAMSMGMPFDDLMEHKLFPMLGLTSTYINVPTDRMEAYAFGYNRNGHPVRVNPGIWDSEAYGVKTSTSDLLKFLDANMNAADLDPQLRRAIALTQTGHFRVGNMLQGLGWEMYEYPASLEELLRGNSAEVMFKPNKVEKLATQTSSENGYLINKTGSTNGFGAYAVFTPMNQTGLVILANKNYPVTDRITMGYKILNGLPDLGTGATAD